MTYKINQTILHPDTDNFVRICKRAYVLDVIECIILSIVPFALLVAKVVFYGQGGLEEQDVNFAFSCVICVAALVGTCEITLLFGGWSGEGIISEKRKLDNDLDWLTFAAQNDYIHYTLYLSSLLIAKNAECLSVDVKNLKMEIKNKKTGDPGFIYLDENIAYLEAFSEAAMAAGASPADCNIELNLTAKIPMILCYLPKK